jgi:hypothetical protein
MKFKSSYFIIAKNMLSEPGREWARRDFNLNDTDTARFFDFLRKQRIIERKQKTGRYSCSVLKDPEKLLNLCVEGFKDCERTVLKFVSKRNKEEVLSELSGRNIEFYLGRFSGIAPGLNYVYDNALVINIPDGSYFSGIRLQSLQLDLSISRVKLSEDILLVRPRYWRFLQYQSLKNTQGYNIPSNLYSFLYAASTTNPMGKPQMEYMIKKLGGIGGDFLVWK